MGTAESIWLRSNRARERERETLVGRPSGQMASPSALAPIKAHLKQTPRLAFQDLPEFVIEIYATGSGRITHKAVQGNHLSQEDHF